jgi:hypothetical protein
VEAIDIQLSYLYPDNSLIRDLADGNSLEFHIRQHRQRRAESDEPLAG